ncbi:hypothetical protein AgCh_026331 [Apium graveolens]
MPDYLERLRSTYELTALVTSTAAFQDFTVSASDISESSWRFSRCLLAKAEKYCWVVDSNVGEERCFLLAVIGNVPLPSADGGGGSYNFSPF